MTVTSIFLPLALLAGWSLGQDNPQPTTVGSTCCNEQDLQYMRDLLNSGDCGNTEPTSLGRDCYEVQQNGYNTSGVYTVNPDGSEPFDVSCDMDTDGGGWTVFQRREDGSINFFRNWTDYKDGFGELDGEHWLGNDKLFYLTSQKTYTLRIDLEDFDGESRHAVYDSFGIADSSDNYRISLGEYSGDAGDAMVMVSKNPQFSTPDRDHDYRTDFNCAQQYKGGWWYNKCHKANLNGLYLSGEHTSSADGVNWKPWRGYYYSLKVTEMKFRPALG